MLQGKEPCEGPLATVICLAGVLFAMAHAVADVGPKSGRGAGRLLSLPCSLLRSPTAGRRACVHIHALGVVCLRRYQLTVRRFMHQWLNFLHVLRSNATVKSADVTGRPDAACGSEFPPLSSQNAVGGREWCVPGAVSVSVAEQSQCVYTWQCLQIPVVTEHSKCRHLNSQFNHPNGILSFGDSEETFLFSCVDS